jgi:hypothetical protein
MDLHRFAHAEKSSVTEHVSIVKCSSMYRALVPPSGGGLLPT